MRLSKRAQGLAATTPRETVQGLGTQVKDLLDKLTPMMQGLQQAVPQLNTAMQNIQQLEQQIASMEQAQAKVQEATQTQAQAQGADGPDTIKGGKGDKTPERKLNKKQLDMGQKVEMEHTSAEDKAREIAKDHLAEQLEEGKDKGDQDYYTELKKVHEDKCRDGVPAFWRRNLDYGSR
jgi:uncharacterized protein YoxC